MPRFVALAVSLLAFAAPAPAVAQAIGDATSVVRDVRGVIAGRIVPVAIGDTVYRDQVVRTLADSSAVFTFLDKTGMAIGPMSEVRLDDFVFSGKAGPRTVDAVKGFFRFISGPGDSGHDYKVRTPHATIAVRGTTFDVRVTDTQTTVVLHEGAIDVCNGGSCRAVKPGETVDAGRSEIQPPRPRSPSDWTFTSTPRREQRAALDKADAVLRSTSAANHAAYERRMTAQREAAAKAVILPVQTAQGPKPVPARSDDASRQPAASAPVSQPDIRRPMSPAAAVEQAGTGPDRRATLADMPPSAGAAGTVEPGGLPPLARTARSEPRPTPDQAAPVAGVTAPLGSPPLSPLRDAFAMPAGTVLNDQPLAGEPVVLAGDQARRLLSSAPRTHDPAILVVAADPPDAQPSQATDWLLPIPDPRARAGPPLRPG